MAARREKRDREDQVMQCSCSAWCALPLLLYADS